MSGQNDIDLSKLRSINEGYKPKHREGTSTSERGYQPVKAPHTSTPPPKKP